MNNSKHMFQDNMYLSRILCSGYGFNWRNVAKFMYENLAVTIHGQH